MTVISICNSQQFLVITVPKLLPHHQSHQVTQSLKYYHGSWPFILPAFIYCRKYCISWNLRTSWNRFQPQIKSQKIWEHSVSALKLEVPIFWKKRGIFIEDNNPIYVFPLPLSDRVKRENGSVLIKKYTTLLKKETGNRVTKTVNISWVLHLF